MTREEMLAHAEQWVAAWNRRDLDAILRPFAADACFMSPKAARLSGSTTLTGSEAIAGYLQKASASITTLMFRLDTVTCDVEQQEMVVIYWAYLDGTIVRACEVMRFDRRGKQISSEAMYGAVQHPLPPLADHQVWPSIFH